eukprot:Pompholyxophrys_punicea_v1_NODE_24_length_5258_cov_21.593175.p5 type:complete len:113 gc:universal NODE_24_length_5258_cov_21.593175:548-886(+)
MFNLERWKALELSERYQRALSRAWAKRQVGVARKGRNHYQQIRYLKLRIDELQKRILERVEHISRLTDAIQKGNIYTLLSHEAGVAVPEDTSISCSQTSRLYTHKLSVLFVF